MTLARHVVDKELQNYKKLNQGTTGGKRRKTVYVLLRN